MTVRVGVIGCGKIGQVGHLNGYKGCPDAEIVAVADANINTARDVAQKYNVPKYFKDYKELLALKEIDAVSVAVPNFLHAEMTIAACKAKKHVLVEKPMATSIKEAKAMISAADKNKVLIQVCMAHRFNPVAQTAKKVLESGILGRINTIIGQFGSPGPEFWSPEGKWFFDKKHAMGGAMADLGIHEIDLIRYLVGSEVVKVCGFTATHEKKSDVEDSGVASLYFKNGVLGNMYASWTFKPGGQQITIYCEKGTLYFGKVPKYDRALMIELTEPKGILFPEVPKESEYGNRYQHFIQCVKTGKKPIVDGYEGLKGLEVILATYKSCSENKIINLPLKD